MQKRRCHGAPWGVKTASPRYTLNHLLKIQITKILKKIAKSLPGELKQLFLDLL